MPKTAVLIARLSFKLAIKQVERFLIFRILGLLIDTEKDFSGVDTVKTDKLKMNIPVVIKEMNATLEGASHLRNTEPHYCAIKPMILAEELMGDGSVLPTDYKFHCIKGKVADVFVVCERLCYFYL